MGTSSSAEPLVCTKTTPSLEPMSHNLAVPITIIGQYLDGFAIARAEYKKGAAHRVGLESLAADGHQAIDAATKVHRLHRHQQPHLRHDRDHTPGLQKACANGSTSAK